MKIWTLWLLLAAFATGCSFAPEYQRPRQEMPDTWCRPVPMQRPSVPDCAAPEVEYAALSLQWWKRFQDPALDALVEQALAHNRDIEQGLARVDKARAALLAARGGLFPELTAQGSCAEPPQPQHVGNAWAGEGTGRIGQPAKRS